MNTAYLRQIYQNLDLSIPDATEIEQAYAAAQRCAATIQEGDDTMFPRANQGRPIMKTVSKFARFLAGVEGFARPIVPPATPPNTSPALRARLLALHILSATAGPGVLK